jgi:hypothetical protein
MELQPDTNHYLHIKIYSGIFPPFVIPWNGGMDLAVEYLKMMKGFLFYLRHESKQPDNADKRKFERALKVLPDAGILNPTDLVFYLENGEKVQREYEITGEPLLVKLPFLIYSHSQENTWYEISITINNPIIKEGDHLWIEGIEEVEAFSYETCAALENISLSAVSSISSILYLKIYQRFGKVDPKFATGLKDYQLFVSHYMRSHNGLLCWHDAGTGKTLTAISTIVQYLLDDRNRRVFVVGPASVVGQWELEIQRHVLPRPSNFTLDRIERCIDIVRRIQVISYDRFDTIIEGMMSSVSHMQTFHKSTMYVFDEIHDVPAKLFNFVNKKLKPTRSYWIRGACVFHAEKVLFLSATPLINALSDMKQIFHNIMIVRETRPKPVELLQYQKVLQNQLQRSKIEDLPELPHLYQFRGEDVKFSNKLSDGLKMMNDVEYDQYIKPKLNVLFKNLHGMIHRIVRDPNDSEFPSSIEMNHRLIVPSASEYAQQYNKAIQQKLIFPKLKNINPTQVSENIITDLDTSFFNNQRLMSSRIYN